MHDIAAIAAALRCDSAALKYPTSVAGDLCPVSAMVSPIDTFCRAASVTNPDLSECAANSFDKPASTARS